MAKRSRASWNPYARGAKRGALSHSKCGLLLQVIALHSTYHDHLQRATTCPVKEIHCNRPLPCTSTACVSCSWRATVSTLSTSSTHDPLLPGGSNGSCDLHSDSSQHVEASGDLNMIGVSLVMTEQHQLRLSSTSYTPTAAMSMSFEAMEAVCPMALACPPPIPSRRAAHTRQRELASSHARF